MSARWVLALFLIAAPAFAAFRCPARGGAAWREYRSAHFLVDTDASAKDGQALVRKLEHVHSLILQALVGEQVEIPGRVRVLAFSDPTDFAEMGGSALSGYYDRGVFDEPSIVLPLNSLWNDPETIAHELTHHLSFFLFPVQQHWFTEGLAEWVQTVAALPADKGTPSLGSHIVRGANALSGGMAGSIPFNLVSWLGYDSRPMPASELLAWDGRETGTAARGHLWSWLLYHWLWNERSKAFADYQKRLADSGDPDSSWRGAFPEFDPRSPAALAKLDDALERYRSTGRFAFFKVQAEGNPAFSEGPVTSADLHLYILGLRVWPKDKEERLALRRSLLEEALAEDRGNPIALYEHMRLMDKLDVPALRAAVQARPADWRGWLVLGEAVLQADKEPLLRKAVELNPLSSRAQNELAWTLAVDGKPREALPVANKALDLAPWDANIVDTLAEVASRLGKCAEALQLEKRAVATSPGEGLKKRQEVIEQRCSTSK
ncbi:MAG TPA: hypothetical protein VMK66_00800 [Myxococcales bacterium]|nr:hypothetical protein [Myxococcales bacterium]